MKRCSTSLVTREMQIETEVRYPFIPIRIAKIGGRKKQFQVLVRIWNNYNSSMLLVGVWNGTTTLENSWFLLIKFNTYLTMQPSSPAPWCLLYLREMKTYSPKKPAVKLIVAIFKIAKKLETTQMPSSAGA